MDKKILIIEDEKSISDILKFILEREGYITDCSPDGEDGLFKALNLRNDLVLLDVMLPRMDGFEVCRKIREKSSVPIIMLTAREEEIDKVLGLELGADDYVTKPFANRELLARIKANLRRTAPQALADSTPPGQSGLFIDENAYLCYKEGKPVDLTLREFELLKYLFNNPGKVMSREELLKTVWSFDYGDLRTVDVTVRRLREKLETDPADPQYILTRRGVGYYYQSGK